MEDIRQQQAENAEKTQTSSLANIVAQVAPSRRQRRAMGLTNNRPNRVRTGQPNWFAQEKASRALLAETTRRPSPEMIRTGAEAATVPQLKEMLTKLGVEFKSKERKADLVDKLVTRMTAAGR